MDINSVLWIWSTRTPTHTEILLHGLVLILHFYGTCARTHAKCSARTQVSCTSPNPVNYIYWVEIRSTQKHQLNNINYMGSCDLHIDRVWACAIIQAWGECLVYGLSNWAIHIYMWQYDEIFTHTLVIKLYHSQLRFWVRIMLFDVCRPHANKHICSIQYILSIVIVAIFVVWIISMECGW